MLSCSFSFPPHFLILLFNTTFNLQSQLHAALSKLMCSVPVNWYQLVRGKFEGEANPVHVLFDWFQGPLDASQLFPWECVC